MRVRPSPVQRDLADILPSQNKANGSRFLVVLHDRLKTNIAVQQMGHDNIFVFAKN